MECGCRLLTVLQRTVSRAKRKLFGAYRASVYVRGGKSDAVKGNTEACLGDTELRPHWPPLSVRVSTTNPSFQVSSHPENLLLDLS